MATMQLEMPAASVAVTAAVLTEKDVAAMLNLSMDTVRAMQLTAGDGPAYTQFADGRIRYSSADVFKFQSLRSAAHQRLMDSIRGGRSC